MYRLVYITINLDHIQTSVYSFSFIRIMKYDDGTILMFLSVRSQLALANFICEVS